MLCVFFCFPISANDNRFLVDEVNGLWVSPGFIYENGNGFQMNINSFDASNYPIVSVWVRTNFNKEVFKEFKSAKSRKTLFEFNCSSRTFRVIQVKLYEKFHNEGKLLYTKPYDSPPNPTKDTFWEEVYSLACDAGEELSNAND